MGGTTLHAGIVAQWFEIDAVSNSFTIVVNSFEIEQSRVIVL